MNLSPQKIISFQEKVLSWYAENKRDLPWRKTTNPYEILVSEIMLQQTQVDRVIPFYHRFLATFPTFEALSKADKVVLLKLWQGLGYNNRVLRLQRLAQELTAAQKPFPQTYEQLLELPGIGPYTARAVLAFAFNCSVPVVDTNIRRVLTHELSLPETLTPKELEQIAEQCIPEGKSRLWHNALMDYGALHATAAKTGIESLSKQGTFEGSTRQVRSTLVKYLLAHRQATSQELSALMPHKEFKSILEKMLKEHLIKEEQGKIVL